MGYHCPSPGELSEPGIKPSSLTSPTLTGRSFTTSATWEAPGSARLQDTRESESHLAVSNSLRVHGLHSPWNSPGQNTGVGSFSILQGIFPTKGSNPGLPHCKWILYQLSHKGGSRILEWVDYPFSCGSYRPRNRTRVSCIAGRFFTS